MNPGHLVHVLRNTVAIHRKILHLSHEIYGLKTLELGRNEEVRKKEQVKPAK